MEKIILIKEGTFVKATRTGVVRFVTKIRKDVFLKNQCFEDDGKISGQAPSTYCHFHNYEPLFK